ncbi:DDE-type integrase/transposase/recombinase [Halanaerobium congolense]|jgi:transposase-like protein|uniref:DDE-type integrase/transposase/recombinase n=1 Tax=Halanaerobium congolense TaxID=54121 RepID=UPI0010E16C28|nr:DDE-type integrase/transposase/recombinase [Halanaerobium congolense]TDP12315.1 DDE superfamily endonuclease [Halanaerobium congolense]
MDFYVGLGLSLRQTKRALKLAYNVSPSAQTIQNWTVSLAHRLGPKIKDLDLPLSGIVAVDETYIKVKGSWHYLFTAIDGKNGCIIAQHLSKHRDAKGAITILKRIIDQYQGQDFVLVSDMAPIYRAAVHAAKAFLKTDVDHNRLKDFLLMMIIQMRFTDPIKTSLSVSLAPIKLITSVIKALVPLMVLLLI